MTGPLAVLMLGTGYTREHHVPALKQLRADYRVVGVFGRSEEKARAIARDLPGDPVAYTDLERALAADGAEAVDVALPIGPSADTIERAFERGLHVFSEKPIAESVDRARALLERHAERRDLTWCVAENFRFWPAALCARDLIASGEIGTPLLCHYPTLVPVKGTPYFQSAWRQRPEYAGGFLLDGGVHDVATMRLMFGEVTEVSAFVRSVDPQLPPADTLVASVTFASGLVASYSVSYALDPLEIRNAAAARALLRGQVRAIRDRYGRKHIVGTRGSLFFLRDRVEVVKGLRRTVVKPSKADVMQEEFLEFRAAVRDGRPLRNTPQEALRDLEVVEAILTAAAEKAVVRLPETPAASSPEPRSEAPA